MLSERFADDARVIDARLRRLAPAWAGSHDWLSIPRPDRGVEAYQVYPYLLREEFGPIAQEALETFAVSMRLYAESFLTLDAVIDREWSMEAACAWALGAQAQQFEAHRLLSTLLPPGSDFWAAYPKCFVRYAEAMAGERSRWNERPSANDLAVALQIARDKSAMAGLVVHGLAALSGSRAADVEVLVTAFADYLTAFQLHDDLRDWKKDFRDRQPTYVVLRVIADEQTAELTEDRFARVLYGRGHAADVLERAIELVGRARAVIGSPGAHTHMTRFIEVMRSLQRDLQDLCTRRPVSAASAGA